MVIICLLLVGLLIFARQGKVPIWIFSGAWLACILPIALGLVSYDYFDPWDPRFASILAAYLACFVAGVWLHTRLTVRTNVSVATLTSTLRHTPRSANLAWCAGFLGTALLVVDFALHKQSASELSALREIVTRAESVSWLSRIASLLTWGSLYSYGYALFYKQDLSRGRFIIYLLPVCGFFLVALVSAGRQAALQIAIFSMLVQMISPDNHRGRGVISGWMLALGIATLMVIYMGYVAVARNDGYISHDKATVLETMFHVGFAAWAQNFLSLVHPEIKGALVEGVVYFSSPIALFSKFVSLDFPSTSGAMTFPFLMRQLEPITGVSVVGALNDKIQLMWTSGVMDVGWTTAISGYMSDFGRVGAGLALLVQGFYTSYACAQAKRSSDFHENVVAVVLLTVAIYLPLLPGSGDTNLFLLWAYCAGLGVRRKLRKGLSLGRRRNAAGCPTAANVDAHARSRGPTRKTNL